VDTKRQQILMVVMFGTLLACLLLPILVLPTRAISTTEVRGLAQKPPPPTSLTDLDNYFREWDGYLSDQIPYRDTWIKTYFFTQVRILGKSHTDKVIVGRNGYLFSVRTNVAEDRTALDKMIESATDLAVALQKRMSVYGGKALFVGLPDKNWLRRQDYPSGVPYPSLNDAAEGGFAAALASRQLASLSLAPILEAHPDERIYYKTDHHWTFAGAYLGYTAIMQALDLGALEPKDLDYVSYPNPFSGSQNRSLGYVIPNDDTFSIGLAKNHVPYDLTVDGKQLPNSKRYCRPPQSTSTLLGYSTYYPYANSAEVIVDTHRPDLPDLLLVGNSFKGATQPLLYVSFNVTRQIDLRSYQAMSLLDYVTKYKPDYLVFIVRGSDYLTPPWNAYDKATDRTTSGQE
jgi:hypothetical protein